MKNKFFSALFRSVTLVVAAFQLSGSISHSAEPISVQATWIVRIFDGLAIEHDYYGNLHRIETLESEERDQFVKEARLKRVEISQENPDVTSVAFFGSYIEGSTSSDEKKLLTMTLADKERVRSLLDLLNDSNSRLDLFITKSEIVTPERVRIYNKNKRNDYLEYMSSYLDQVKRLGLYAQVKATTH